MDYKYIEQLLERYWECETSLQEEEILRSFFSQDNVPGSLLQYKALFTYEQTQKQTEVLGEDFDDRMAELVAEQQPVKARTVSLTQRLMPFFRAAAIVAIILTLGNALQVAFVQEAPSTINMAGVEVQKTDVNSVAYSDTVKIDTMQKAVQATPIVK